MTSEEQQTSFTSFCNKYIADTVGVMWHLKDEQIKDALALIEKTRDAGGTVWLIGNGGLASLAEHMAVDFQLAGVRAIALTQSAAVTTYANDVCFDNVFTEQLGRLSMPGDCLIQMSGSGNSTNVLTHGPAKVNKIGIGGSNGKLKNYVDVYIGLPTTHVGMAQDAAQVVLHILTYWLMEQHGRA